MRNIKSWGVCAVTVLTLLPVQKAWSWGFEGHRLVAETAALLLQKELAQSWGPLLARHRSEMGYYSILPDSHYRQTDGNQGKTEAPTHFFNVDVATGISDFNSPDIEKAVEGIPRKFSEADAVLSKRVGKKWTETIGSAPWRVEQFQELAYQAFKTVKEIKGGYQTGKMSKGDTKKIYDGLYFLGVLAHYSGDVTVPYHATSDWNGWKVGQGGIHFYFEADCVNALEPLLGPEVLESARKNQSAWLSQWRASSDTTPGVMMWALLDSGRRLGALNQVDKEKVVIQASSEESKKVFAKRKPAEEACPALRPMLVEALAKASVLTAHFWQQILPRDTDFTKQSTLLFSDFALSPKYYKPSYKEPSFNPQSQPSPSPEASPRAHE
jgi:hypothetical protein